ncbi:MAG: hypothetical protein ACRD29_14830 [Acidimicrobiales bacterium]
MRRRPAVGPAIVVGTLWLAASPAAADPAKPGDYRSTVTAVTPVSAGVVAEVVGGDAFLSLTVDSEQEVTVLGYENEPYIRFAADGTVAVNQRSPASWINEDRFGATEAPADADAQAPPRWEEVGSGGEWAWHDHRIHWMVPDSPPGVGADGLVFEWAVPIDVDGRAVDVQGRLVREEPTAPWPWVLIGAVVAGGLVGVGWVVRERRRAVAVLAAIGGLVAGGGALAATVGEAVVLPPGADTGWLPLVVAAVAVGAGVAAAVTVIGRWSAAVARVATLVAAACAGWSAVLRLPVLWEPVLVGGLPEPLDRAVTAIALAGAAGAAWLIVGGGRSPGRSVPAAITES